MPILPFVPKDRDELNREIDQEILDRERQDELKRIADEARDELDLQRFLKGEIDLG